MRKAAISTDAVLRQGCQLSARVLGGAGAFTFAAGFCVGGALVLITEGALPGETAAHFSAACVPFNGCGSSIVVGGAFSHLRNGFLISNPPGSPADQPSEECAAKTRWSCCSIRIASSFLTGDSAPCRVKYEAGVGKIRDIADRDMHVYEWDTLVQQGCRGSKEVQVLLRLRPANAAYSSLQKGWAKASAGVIAVTNCKGLDTLWC